MIKKVSILTIALLSVFLVSCEKPEGIGGNASIKGTIMVEVYDKEFKTLQETFPATDEDVFIIYGNDDSYSDKTSTSSNGLFEFNYLTKGEYTVFVYSEDTSKNNIQDIEIKTAINISSNKSTSDLGEIKIFKSVDYDDGYATIKGFIYQNNYDKNTKSFISTTKSQELDVYLAFGDDNNLIERTRTLNDGSFSFTNLIKGNYKVIYYSEDINGGIELIPQIKEISIENYSDIMDLGTLFITNRD